jgi:hypothetical protein
LGSFWSSSTKRTSNEKHFGLFTNSIASYDEFKPIEYYCLIQVIATMWSCKHGHDMKTWEEISEIGLEWGCNIAILFKKFTPYYLTAVGSQIAQIVACVSLKYVNSITLNSCKILTPVAKVALPTSLDIEFFCHPYVIHK